MGRILNPTGHARTVMSAGIEFHFEPFSIREVAEPRDFVHITKAKAQWGLVSLDPTNEERLKYKQAPNEFFRAQALKGLAAYRKIIEQALIDERNAAQDVRNKRMEPNDSLINPKRFEAMLKEIDAWIDEVKSKAWSPAKYLKNIMRDEVEPFDYSDKVPSEARRAV